MKYIEYGETSDGSKLFAREDDDGLIRFTCIESNPDYQAYLAAQSTPSIPEGGN